MSGDRPFCPHCGYDFERDAPVTFGAILSDPRGAFVCGGTTIRLTTTERLIVHTLTKARGAWVSHHAITERVGWESDNALNLLAVYVHKIRKRLRDAGVDARIECGRGLGYRWLPSPALAEAA